MTPNTFGATTISGYPRSRARSAAYSSSLIGVIRPPAPSTTTMSHSSAQIDIPDRSNSPSTSRPSVRAARWGGSGARNLWWSVLRDATTPFMLAGGLNPENIKEALFQGALGLDLNSGVEQSPGKKCPNKLQNAFTSIRNY